MLDEKKLEVETIVSRCAAELHESYPRHSKAYYIAELLQRSLANGKVTREKATNYHAYLSLESTRINDGELID